MHVETSFVGHNMEFRPNDDPSSPLVHASAVLGRVLKVKLIIDIPVSNK